MHICGYNYAYRDTCVHCCDSLGSPDAHRIDRALLCDGSLPAFSVTHTLDMKKTTYVKFNYKIQFGTNICLVVFAYLTDLLI